MGVSCVANVASVTVHLDMQLCVFLVVAQPWQGPRLPCSTSALAFPYTLLHFKHLKH